MNTALVDYDTWQIGNIQTQIKILRKKAEMLNRYLNLRCVAAVIKKTNHGYHVYLHFRRNDLNHTELCLLQSILGDDWRRALLNWNRIRKNCHNWNILYSQKAVYLRGKRKILSREHPYRVVRFGK